MDTVIFDGVEYTKASVAAKILRYTSDYLGQLCRGKKIDARLVGRTWFVNLESVHEHKKTKYQNNQSNKQSPQSIDTDNKIKLSRPSLQPVEQYRQPKKALPLDVVTALPLSRSLRVSYDIDDGHLIPEIIKKKSKPPRTIIIEQVSAQKLNIGNRKGNVVDFKASELPTVALSGSLRVTSYPDAVTQVEEKPKNKVISVKRESTPSSLVAPVRLKMGLVKDIPAVPALATNVVSEKINKVESKILKKPILETTKPNNDTKTENTKVKFSPKVVEVADLPKSSPWVTFSPAIATLLALVCVGLIFSASANVIALGSGFDSGVTFQLANLLEILRQ